uniref:Putative GTP-binding protein n=1 Tax=Trypanosoma congolense (strain IL3000) TaxID=1068625 RepID=G0UZM8_TRYCI|nr:putative GTP-binding protein [Trypanosoma congolense IL3000]
MGGQSKKRGRGGGGGGGQARNCLPHQRKKLTKDPGVPDLKKVAQNLTRTAQNRNRSLFSIPALRGASTLHPPPAVSGPSAPNDDEARVAAERRAMTMLAVQCAEKVHHYEAPQRWMSDPENMESLDEESERRGADRSLRRFFKEFQKVVENSDVLLQVVDARDPLGCRLNQLERAIRSQFGDKKKMVIVLNKADLLPSKEVTEKWIQFFEHHEGIACIPFIATAKGAMCHTYVTNMFRCLRALATSEETGARKSIVGGVIGYPNVGKSSVINALKRKHVVGVGNMPGFTTGNTEVELRSDIRVMDCPGVVAPGEDCGDVVLRNAVKVSDLSDPFTPVQRLLHRCAQVGAHGERGQMSHTASHGVHPLGLFYNVGSFDPNDVMSFIQLVGQRRGRLMRGGVVDEEGTARMILNDWNDGRIAYYTLPPTSDLFGRQSFTTGGSAEGGHIGCEEDDDNGPQLVEGLAQGLQWEGLPTFHLAWERMNSAIAPA